MTTKRTLQLLALSIVATVGLAACGGGGGKPSTFQASKGFGSYCSHAKTLHVALVDWESNNKTAGSFFSILATAATDVSSDATATRADGFETEAHEMEGVAGAAQRAHDQLLDYSGDTDAESLVQDVITSLSAISCA